MIARLRATPGALGLALVAAALAWRRRYWSVVGRVHYTLVTLGANESQDHQA